MAHSDYDCCAVCDEKMEYKGPYSTGTKEEICSNCLRVFKSYGYPVYDVPSLIAWVKHGFAQVVYTALFECGYSKCIYDNPVDMVLFPKFEEGKKLAENAPKTEVVENAEETIIDKLIQAQIDLDKARRYIAAIIASAKSTPSKNHQKTG